MVTSFEGSFRLKLYDSESVPSVSIARTFTGLLLPPASRPCLSNHIMIPESSPPLPELQTIPPFPPISHLIFNLIDQEALSFLDTFMIKGRHIDAIFVLRQ
jgi:hypothetical protein